MKIFITGGGVVATYTALEAEKQGVTSILFELSPDNKSTSAVWENSQVITGDITNKQGLNDAIQDFAPDVIVHTAALRQRMAQANPELAQKVNVEGTKIVVEIASEKNIPLLHLSSDTIYGTALESNESINEDSKINPQTIYAETKAKAEEIVKNFDKAIILRSTSLYAPWLGSASTFNEVIRDIINSGLEGKDFEKAVSFAETSEQLYVKDLAQAIISSITINNLEHKVYNIGAGTLVSYEDISREAKSLFNITVNLTDKDLGADRVQSVRSLPLDISRAQKELDYNPQFQLEKAFGDYSEKLKEWRKD